MAQFKAIEIGMQVNGTTVASVIEGMGMFERTARAYLAEKGISDLVADTEHWYSQQAWLDVFEKIADEIGESTLFQIGMKIPENAAFPPDIDNVEKALASIDVAYHMNHRNAQGQVLFDPTESQPNMLEGIGHYHFRKVPDQPQVIMTCDNPYPCAFDKGIIKAVGDKFKPAESLGIMVSHDEDKQCRKNGTDVCEYTVSW